IKWELEFSFLNDLLDQFISDKAFKKYQALQEPSWEEDVKWIIHCYRNHIATSDFLYDFLEDQSINWIDDLPLVNTYFLKTLGKLKTDEDYALPFPQFNKQNEDLLFGRELLEKVIINQEALEQELEGKTPNWEADRIAYIDRIILKIAIAELLYFPSIPAKVTLNEYLELAKDYSTPKSNHFVNGVLDKLVKEFEQENRLNKTVRGLL
ncbi:MAG: transcription antitermination factor NusB, partial [Flavobacteriaceae bacterium]